MSEAAAGTEVARRCDLRGVLPVGTFLRCYELKSILGQGAFGITYRGRDLTLNRDVAIKEYLPTTLAVREGRTTVLPRSPAHAEQFAWGRERFLDEARTLAKLDRTPSIVRVHDYLEDNGTAYMVMALVEGETLNKRLMREQRLVPQAIEHLLFPLLDGLEEVHAAGFLHRDIKPANIMVDARGRPTLIDFGASRAAMAERSTTLTAIFTPGYAAAEQFTTTSLGPWSDIYGLAATLYHAITGTSPPSAIDRILKDTYRPLSDLQPTGFSPGLLAGIDAGLSIRAEDRPQSIVEWREALRLDSSQPSILAVTKVARRPGPLARAARRTRRTRITLGGRALWSAGAAAVLLFTGAGILVYQAGMPVDPDTATLNLTAEQLEKALAERRRADALAAEKRTLEDEARQKAEIDAEAQRQAEAELEQARQARQKAETDLAKLKADIEARRGTDAGQPAALAQLLAEEAAKHAAEMEAATLRQAEDEALRKAATEAEARRQADEALARAETERRQAEREARLKSAAEEAALRQSSEDTQRKAAAEDASRRQAEEEAQAKAKVAAEKDKADAAAAENALRLELTDRKRLQVALTSQGFDTRRSDGVFGAWSREMIAAWQRKVGAPATGFLTAAQRDQLLRSAAPAVARWDEEQKKTDDEARANSKTAAAAPLLAPLPSTTSQQSTSSPAAGAFDGTYSGSGMLGSANMYHPAAVTIRISGATGSGDLKYADCTSSISLQVSPSGEVTGSVRNCRLGADVAFPVRGRIRDGQLDATFSGSQQQGFVALKLGAKSAPLPSVTSTYDGVYSGAFPSLGGTGVRPIKIRIAGARGSGTMTAPGCSPTEISFDVSPQGDISGQVGGTCGFQPSPAEIYGRVGGGALEIFVGSRAYRAYMRRQND